MSTLIATVKKAGGSWDVHWTHGGSWYGYSTVEAAKEAILSNVWDFQVEVEE